MTAPPPNPKIYHITHVDNLPRIVARGALVSDALVREEGGPAATIGMSNIKSRRLDLPVTCHPGDKVGEYVPFYFCPRSIMLYIIHMANHPDLTYRGGQDPIVHLEADLHEVIASADAAGQRWAFSLSNAGAVYAGFRATVAELDQVDWAAVSARDFRPPEVKEGKQAEFLVHRQLPWSWITRIGVTSEALRVQAAAAIERSPHRPPIEIQPEWYY